MSKINPLVFVGAGLGVAALFMFGGSGSAKAADTKDTTKTPDGDPGPGQNPGGVVPSNATELTSLKGASRFDQDTILGSLGYALPDADKDGSLNRDQLERFQAHYNMVSRQAGKNISAAGETFPIPSNMGGVDVTGKRDDSTLAAALFAVKAVGGPDYADAQLKPFLAYARGETFQDPSTWPPEAQSAEEAEEFAALLMDTAWLDVVRSVADSLGQWRTVEWIDQGAQPDYTFDS